jgi:hypothetical protein
VAVSTSVPMVTCEALHFDIPLVVLAAESRRSSGDIVLLFVVLLGPSMGVWSLRTVRWVGVAGSQTVGIVGVDVGCG